MFKPFTFSDFYKSQIIALVFCTLLLIGSGIQLLFVYGPLSSAKHNSFACELYLCDENELARRAFDLQLGKPSENSLRTAIQILQTIVAENNADPRGWVDLAQAYEQAGFISRAHSCFLRALILGPNSTDVLEAAGDFFLKHSDPKQGVSCLNRALNFASDQDTAIFSYFLARQIGMAQIFSGEPPLSSRAAQSFFRYLMSEGMLREATQVWNSSAARRLLNEQTAIEYVNFLLQQNHPDEAFQAFVSQLGLQKLGYGKTEFIFNGDFERIPGSALFDWQIKSGEHVEAILDGTAFSGKRSLKLSFDGAENTDYSQTVQETLLPAGKYQLEAFIRAKDVTTDQGIRIQIKDRISPQQLTLETENVTGSCSWRKVQTRFVVSGTPRIIQISVLRHPSLRLDNKISGNIWVDGISIRPTL